MHPDDWQLTHDIDDFLTRAGDFLRSRPALHNTALTDIGTLRTRRPDLSGTRACLFGHLESGGEVRAAFYGTPRGRLGLTPLTADEAGTLAARLADHADPPAHVIADDRTATAFAEAWRRHTGAETTLFWKTHLHRLGALTPPRPNPGGRARPVGEREDAHVVRWCREFCVEVGEQRSIDLIDAGSWRDSRFGDRHFTLWESPDGTPVAMAAATTMTAGMVRIDPVYTPARYRGNGYAGAVTAEVSGNALAEGATDVVLYTDPDNPTSNALYRRLGYVRIAGFGGYAFT